MNYEASIHLSDEKFKRLVGIERRIFNEMLACLEQAQATVHQKGGRKLKIGMPNLLMATLQYFKEYRTYEQIKQTKKYPLVQEAKDDNTLLSKT